MTHECKRRRSSSIGDPSKRLRPSPSPEEIIEGKLQMMETEHENIALLLHYRRVVRGIDVSNPLYFGALGDLRLQMEHTGRSTTIQFLETDSDSEFLFKMQLLLQILLDDMVYLSRMPELSEDGIFRIEANHRNNSRLAEEISQLELEIQLAIKRRAEAERNYSIWLDSSSDLYVAETDITVR